MSEHEQRDEDDDDGILETILDVVAVAAYIAGIVVGIFRPGGGK